MANEATIRSGFSIRKTDSSGTRVLVNHNTLPSAFVADVVGAKGPVPGAVEVTASPTAIDLSGLDTPGLCRVMNQDETNRISVTVSMELLPGESFVFRLNSDYGTLGTGTPTSVTDFVAETDPGVTASLLVEAFER